MHLASDGPTDILAGAGRDEGVHVSDYTLPDLPYDYGALEPHISGQIMELHHSKHH
ncbi:hypothetical protein GCM10023317_72810 [Actinopolymorpha pittospori]